MANGQSPEPLTHQKILVVDDEPAVVNMLAEGLRRHGYEVITAGGGVEALRLARQELPDLILLDVLMPDKDGFAVLAELKADETTRTIPVVMLSARGETKALFEGAEHGAIDYLIKPCKWDELLKYVRKYGKSYQ